MTRGLHKSLLEAIVASTRDGIVVVDAGKEGFPVVFVNTAFERMTGYDAAELSEQGLSCLQRKDKGQRAIGEMRDALEAGRSCDVLLRNYRKDGGLFWNQLRLVPVEEKGTIAWWIGIARDVGDLRDMQDRLRTQRKALEEVRHQSPKDRLTAIGSRAYFDDMLAREWSICQREERSIALFLFDVDFFDSYNQTFGRRAGDSCLKRIAGAIRGSFRRGGDVVARFEGQRFACFASAMEEAPALGFGGKICERIRALCIHHPRSPGGRYVTVSCGVTVMTPVRDSRVEELLAAAEAALRRAKSAGRGRASA